MYGLSKGVKHLTCWNVTSFGCYQLDGIIDHRICLSVTNHMVLRGNMTTWDSTATKMLDLESNKDLISEWTRWISNAHMFHLNSFLTFILETIENSSA